MAGRSGLLTDQRGLCGTVHTWRVCNYLLYDADSRSKSKDGALCSVFFCGILFQLYHTVCIRRTANADLFYEKGQTSDSCHYAGPYDCHDYL